MRSVPIQYVQDGAFLGEAIRDSNGRVLLQKGVKLSASLLTRIKNLGFQTVYINDEYSDNEVEDIVSPQVREKGLRIVKETFEKFQSYSEAKNCDFTKRRLQGESESSIQSIKDIGNSIVDDITNAKKIMINLVDIKSLDNYTYQHSVNVTILALVLGVELGLNKNELRDLSIGALLHDLGKVFIPKEILLKKDKLTTDELKVVQQHPIKGYEYLKGRRDISALSKIIIMQHHERLDGSGYPDKKANKDIHKFAKIVAIADVYDVLTSDRPHKKAIPPNEALEYIMGSAGRKFDFDMVNIFCRKVMPYPVDSLVKLSNGMIGVVEEITYNYPLRPKIKVIKKNMYNKFEIEYIDLLEENSIVIEKIQYELPDIPAIGNKL